MKTALSLNFPGFIQYNSNYVLVNQQLDNSLFSDKNLSFLKLFYTPNILKKCNKTGVVYFSHKKDLNSFFNLINKWLVCFNTLQIVGFELWGLGLTLMPLESWWKTGRIWVFKLGFSHRVFFVEPYNLRIVWQHRLSDFRRRKFFMISNDLMVLRTLAYILKHLQTLNLYKFRGFKFINENVSIKTGKVNRV